jgi:transposase
VVYIRIDSIRRRCGGVLRGKDVHELEQMKQSGLSVSAISEVTGFDRKTVRKYLLEPEAVPAYRPRVASASKLDPHKPFLKERLTAGVWNAQVSLREIRQRGYTILKDWLHPQRAAASAAAVRRFETPPGKQSQVDWGHLGYLDIARSGISRSPWDTAADCGRRRPWTRNWGRC